MKKVILLNKFGIELHYRLYGNSCVQLDCLVMICDVNFDKVLEIQQLLLWFTIATKPFSPAWRRLSVRLQNPNGFWILDPLAECDRHNWQWRCRTYKQRKGPAAIRTCCLPMAILYYYKYSENVLFRSAVFRADTFDLTAWSDGKSVGKSSAGIPRRSIRRLRPSLGFNSISPSTIVRRSLA